MCYTIVVNNGLPDMKEIQCPKDLESHFKIKCISEDNDDIIPDACLCQVDIEKTLDYAGIKYEYDPTGPYYFVSKIKL